MDAQVVREKTGDRSTWAVNVAPPDHARLATIEQREGYLYVTPLPQGPCATMLDGPYANLADTMRAIGLHLGGTCEESQA